MALPGEGGIRTRKIALLAADGVNDSLAVAVREALQAEGAVSMVVASRVGPLTGLSGTIEAEGSLENAPSVLFDAVVLLDGEQAVETLLRDGRTREFLRDAYRHGKTILAFGTARRLLDRTGISATLPNESRDPGVLVVDADAWAGVASQFIAAVARHRHPERDLDPPLI